MIENFSSDEIKTFLFIKYFLNKIKENGKKKLQKLCSHLLLNKMTH